MASSQRLVSLLEGPRSTKGYPLLLSKRAPKGYADGARGYLALPKGQ
jgi:hypothetical protein